MQFTIERKKLLKPLQQISNSLSNCPKLPILSNILIQVKDNILSLTGTDLEMEIIAYITLSLPCIRGETTISARKFFNICRELPEEASISVKLEEKYVIVQSGKSRFILSTLPSSSFPNLENWCSEIEFHLSQEKMKRLIEMTQFSMAYQDVRYYLNGMLFEIKEKEIRSVSTDGHRLSIYSIPIDNTFSNYSLLIPRKGIIELFRMLNGNEKLLHIQIGNNNIRARIDNFIFTSKLIDGLFPDYRHILLKNPSKILEVDCNILKRAFIRTAILANEKFRSVHLYISKNKLKIIANNSNQEEAEEILKVIYIGEDVEIRLNVNYILDALNALKCKNVRILMTDSASSIQIEDVVSKNAIYIIMPMRM